MSKPDDTEQRLRQMLQGAFAGPPTPLKDIPTKEGESRAVRREKPQKRRKIRMARKSRSTA